MAEKHDKPKTRGLGRGLSALMADVNSQEPESAGHRADGLIAIERLYPNPDQPRRHFEETALEELAASIREKGIIQPLIVRAAPGNDGNYQIVAGERRWRAAQRARLHQLPVLIRDYTETEVLEIAIIENIQRADLSPIDEAQGYRALMDRFGHTQEQMAAALGKSRPHIANLLRLLTLPADVQDSVSAGLLTAGHARALVGHPEASKLAAKVVTLGLSVRETEALTRKKPHIPRQKTGSNSKDADTLQIERELSAHLGMGVTIEHKAGAENGKLTLHYRNLEQFDDILRALGG